MKKCGKAGGGEAVPVHRRIENAQLLVLISAA
jgi:hypothetical protein